MDYAAERSREIRLSDEKVIDTGSRRHYADVLANLSSSWKRPISVLDVGCGTGRFFYCLRNVQYLLGVDISPHMLKKARSPLRAEQISIERIELKCANIFEMELAGQQFDLIYSIGVLGEVASFNTSICRKLLSLLKSEGKMFITLVDTHSRFDGQSLDRRNLYKRLMGRIFPLLPEGIKERINKTISSCYMTLSEIETCLTMAGARQSEITRYQHIIGTGWQGAHYDCLIW